MRTLAVALGSVLSLVSTLHAGEDPHKAKAQPIIDKAISYLRSQQDKDTGGWSVPKEGPAYPAITALVLNGMLMKEGITVEDATVKRGVDFLLKYRQPDGGIYDKVLPSYNTSIVLSTLARVNTPEAKAAIKPAQEFLKSLQFGEGAIVDGQFAKETGRVGKDHPFYGGVGYGRSGRPDTSNLNFFMQALADSGVSERDEAVQRALVFLQRTQMLGETNDLAFAKGSTQGGFIYSTSKTKDDMGGGQSYGGEIAESLSGPPGTVAIITLKPSIDGKPRLLKRDAVKAAIVTEMTANKETSSAADSIMVLMGPTTNGESAARFEVRTAVTSPEVLASVIGNVFKPEGEQAATVEIKAVPAWQGVSRLRAYGTMSYAGFKSYLYAKLPKNDVRVAAAYAWIRHNYTLEENPNLGKDGMYYYFITFARALDAWGDPMIEVVHADGSKESRDWALDLIDRLAALQNPDGSFKSVDDRWMENNPVLITSYALIALQHAAN